MTRSTEERPDTQALTHQVVAALTEWDRGAWCLAALATTDADRPVLDAAAEVLAAAGLPGQVLSEASFSPAQSQGLAASPLLQAAVLAGPAHMLDVGTGTGSLAVAFARRFASLHVTGIDVLPEILEFARATLPEINLEDRVEVRRQNVCELADEDRYDLVWIPAPFIPEPDLGRGPHRIARALRQGGVIMVAHDRFDGGALDNAIAVQDPGVRRERSGLAVRRPIAGGSRALRRPHHRDAGRGTGRYDRRPQRRPGLRRCAVRCSVADSLAPEKRRPG